MAVLDGKKIVFVTDVLLDGPDIVEGEFNHFTALLAVEVPVGRRMPGFLEVLVAFPEVVGLQFPPLAEELERTIDRGPRDALLVPPDFVQQFLRLEMAILVKDYARDFLAFLRKTEPFFVQELAKPFECLPRRWVSHRNTLHFFRLRLNYS
jgi:hypothetical protein